MAKIFPNIPKQESIPPALLPLLLCPPQTCNPPRPELFLQEDASFIVERIGDDGVGGPIEWLDEEFPRVWRKDI